MELEKLTTKQLRMLHAVSKPSSTATSQTQPGVPTSCFVVKMSSGSICHVLSTLQLRLTLGLQRTFSTTESPTVVLPVSPPGSFPPAFTAGARNKAHTSFNVSTWSMAWPYPLNMYISAVESCLINTRNWWHVSMTRE